MNEKFIRNNSKLLIVKIINFSLESRDPGLSVTRHALGCSHTELRWGACDPALVCLPGRSPELDTREGITGTG